MAGGKLFHCRYCRIQPMLAGAVVWVGQTSFSLQRASAMPLRKVD